MIYFRVFRLPRKLCLFVMTQNFRQTTFVFLAPTRSFLLPVRNRDSYLEVVLLALAT